MSTRKCSRSQRYSLIAAVAVCLVLGLGYFSDKVVGSTSPLSPPGKPVLQESTTHDTIQINVNWTVSAGSGVTVQGYTVSRSTDGSNFSVVTSGDTATYTTTGSTVSFTDSVSASASTYYYQVSAYDNNGDYSLPSAVNSINLGPSIVSSFPVTNATSVSLKPPVQIVFDQAMDSTTLNATNITLSESGVGVPGCIVTYDAGNRTANLSVQGTLDPLKTYVLGVTSGIKNSLGVALASGSTITFTTGNGDNYPHGAYSTATAECAACHRSHTASGAKLITATDTSEVCFICHNGVQSNDFLGKDNYNNYGHPVGSGSSHQSSGCGTCHTPHGSSNPKLLIGAYDMSANPAKSDYNPGNQFFCLNNGCHAEFTNLSAGSQTSFRNPVNPTTSATASLDLHYLHLIKAGQDNKGNATCYDCHRPHGAVVSEISGSGQNPALLGAVNLVGFPSTSTVVPASGSSNPVFYLNPDPDQTGGSCTLACHGVTHVSGSPAGNQIDATYNNTP